MLGTLTAWGIDGDTVDKVILCLSELVTNAMIHTDAGCELRVVLDRGVLTTTVRDGGSSVVVDLSSVTVDPFAVHGRGLQLVDAALVEVGFGTGRRRDDRVVRARTDVITGESLSGLDDWSATGRDSARVDPNPHHPHHNGAVRPPGTRVNYCTSLLADSRILVCRTRRLAEVTHIRIAV